MAFSGIILWVGSAVLGALIVAEIVAYRWLRRRGYQISEALATIGIGTAGQAVHWLEGGCVAAVSIFLWSYRIADIPLDTWWGLAGLFVGQEFCYYWYHRASHECRLLWASHSVHHSSEHLNVLAAYRLAMSDLLSGRWMFFLPLVVIGFHPLAVFGMLNANLIYQLWIHTDLIPKLGPLEYVFNTPSSHRVHHARNSEYLDRNHGGVLIVFDRLFGTYAEERAETPCEYGLVEPVQSHNPVKIVLHEWQAMARDARQSRNLREACGYLLGRPGWKPTSQPHRASRSAPSRTELANSPR